MSKISILESYLYTSSPPPEPSPKLAYWVEKIKNGWKPNKRIRSMGYSTATQFFGVYVWEYINVIAPLIYKRV